MFSFTSYVVDETNKSGYGQFGLSGFDSAVGGSIFGSSVFGSSDPNKLNPFRPALRQQLRRSESNDGGVTYKPTSINELDRRGKKCVNKMVSISGMPVYNLKSHEELRWQQDKGSKPQQQPATATFPPATVFKPFSLITKPFQSSSPVFCSSFSSLSTITPIKFSASSFPSTVPNLTPAGGAFVGVSLTQPPKTKKDPSRFNLSSGFNDLTGNGINSPAISFSPFTSTPTKFSTFPSPAHNPTPAGFNHTTQPPTKTEDPTRFDLSAGSKDLTGLNSPVTPFSLFTSTPTKFSTFLSPAPNPTPAGFNQATPAKTEDPSRFDLSAGSKDLTGNGLNSPVTPFSLFTSTPTKFSTFLSPALNPTPAGFNHPTPDGNPNPFGVLPTMPRLSMDLSFNKLLSSPIGISSIPVHDTRAAPKISSCVSPRHLLRSRNKKFPVRKYDPKCDRPKVAFFAIDDGVARTYLIPRENPRALLIRKSED